MNAKMLALVAFLLAYTVQAGAADARDVIVVIVNKANPSAALSRNELRPIFQTTKMQWPDGSRITPYDLPDGDAVRDRFNAAVLGLDPDRVTRYWIDRKIRGGERPPVKLSGPAAVVHAVATNPGAIGYVSASDASNVVKVVAQIRGGEVVAP